MKNEIEEKCETDQEESVPAQVKSQNDITQYLLCFSFVRNTRQIFKTEESTGNVRIFHSMRVLGNLLVILYHTMFYATHFTGKTWSLISDFWFSKFFSFFFFFLFNETNHVTSCYTANKTIIHALSDTIPAQIVANGALSVDTYFFISGFLLTHVFLKGQSKDKKIPSLTVRIKQYLKMFVKRYIRYSIISTRI